VEQPGGCPFSGVGRLPDVQLAGRPVETDVSPARWVAEALAAADRGTVAGLVPPVFESYCRVFHPAVRYAGDDDVDVSWAEVAAANRTVAHPLMAWGSITGSLEFFGEDNQSPLWDDAPAMGHLPEHVAAAVAAVLRRHTTTPEECWFGLSSSGVGTGLEAPELVVPDRAFHLVRGPVELAATNLLPEPYSQSANAWWPADRAWFVATDIDLVTTYIGGSAALVADLLAAPGLETAPATAGQSTAWDADTVNPLPFDAPD
jgi:hypothetical protein